MPFSENILFFHFRAKPNQTPKKKESEPRTILILRPYPRQIDSIVHCYVKLSPKKKKKNPVSHTFAISNYSSPANRTSELVLLSLSILSTYLSSNETKKILIKPKWHLSHNNTTTPVHTNTHYIVFFPFFFSTELNFVFGNKLFFCKFTCILASIKCN